MKKYKNEAELKKDIMDWVVLVSIEMGIPATAYGRSEKFRSGVPDQEIMIEYAPSFFIESKVNHDYSPDQVGWAKSTYEVTKHKTYGVQAYTNNLFTIRPLLDEEKEYQVMDLKAELIKWIKEAIDSTKVVRSEKGIHTT